MRCSIFDVEVRLHVELHHASFDYRGAIDDIRCAMFEILESRFVVGGAIVDR